MGDASVKISVYYPELPGGSSSIATHLRYGDAITVEVSLKAPRAGILKTKPDSKQITVPWLPGVKDLDNRQFIHAVTAQDKIAENVTSLTITHPSPFLHNHVVLIDTPGINANEEHGAITQQVIEKEVDAAIIVIPANIPLSQTLLTFLSSSLSPFLHRCIFIVTRMDQIREREQSRLLNNLRTRLVNQLDIKPPLLYACSAQVFLDLLTGEEAVLENVRMWGDRFTQLENVILQRLQRERSVSIAESIIRLLNSLFEQLDSHLGTQWKNYQSRQSQLQSEFLI